MAYEGLLKRLQAFSEKHVPGLRSYLTKERLRDTDKVVRDQVVVRLDAIKGKLDDAKRQRADAGKLKKLDQMDRVSQQMVKVRDSIKFAARGYRSVWDIKEVAEGELQRLLDFDSRLFEQIALLDEKIAALASADEEGLSAALDELAGKVKEMDESLGERERRTKTKKEVGNVEAF